MSKPRKSIGRWDVLAFLLVVFSPLLFLVVLLLLRDESREAEAALAREIEELVAMRYERPVHAPPELPGSFGQAVRVYIPELVEGRARRKQFPAEEPRVLADILKGKRPPNSLPWYEKQEFERLLPVVQGVLAATHRSHGDPPDELSPLLRNWSEEGEPALRALYHAAWIGLVHLRFQLEEGKPDAAVATCADVLALGRDLGFGTPLGTRRTGEMIQRLAIPGCAAALERASLVVQEDFIEATLRIRDGTFPFVSTLRVARADEALLYAAPMISDRLIEALPPGARAIVEEGREYDRQNSFFTRIVLRDWWSETHRLQPELFRVASLPPTEQMADFKMLEKVVRRSLNPHVSITFVYPKWAARSLGARRALNLLVAAAALGAHQAREAHYPPTLGELADFERLFKGEPELEYGLEGSQAWLRAQIDPDADEAFRLRLGRSIQDHEQQDE